ncbi:DUF305 domain-containing protein [Nakamurella endophytica]|uniref:DUF305 domain-containing protein n=1 Tax=Nakamurella endophytica TaxID=1748367 RepID=A0A917T6D0_9ACTN|nr:DUF305 domain-containing protein [Nakamurella endophytica]GGM09747.1 hypothetical protein GCM10011594_32070 [Nakamurella endophytica]
MGTSSSSSTSAGAGDSTHNDADVMFVQMMIPHHQGAIAMAQLAASRASNQQVKDLAATIEAAQGPEIEQMTAWLQAWGVSTSTADMSSSTAASSEGGMDHGGMDHGGMTMGKDGDMGSSTAMSMPGEMTDEQMQALEAATGPEFDRMFLQMMIEHHTGAVEMAQTELEQGSNSDALQLAESIKSSQTEEIATMQQLLQSL